MLTRAPFPSYGTDSNKLVQRMTAKGVEDLGKIGTSGSFIYGIEPLSHQPLQTKYLDCKESACSQTVRNRL
jgi:hypothetical protein